MAHLVCVDAYEGRFEPLRAHGERRDVAHGLALPWAELTDALDADVTLLSWDDWYAYEQTSGSVAEWICFPFTRAHGPWSAPPTEVVDFGSRVRRDQIPVVDPGRDGPLVSHDLSRRLYGMLAEGDPLFFLSYLLKEALLRLHAERPIDLVLVPMWGGLGYVAQLDRATCNGPLSRTAFAVVATSTSDIRLRANQEGTWTRPAIARRQREELSVALAEVALAFGPEGAALARRARLRSSPLPVLAPRRLDPAHATVLRTAADAATQGDAIRFTYRGCLDGSCGALDVLDATRLLEDRPPRVECDGTDMVFAPMEPRSFQAYWSSRGWVQEMCAQGRWAWTSPSPAGADGLDVRLRVGRFCHLADPSRDAADGAAALYSTAAAEGLSCGVPMPEPLLIAGEPTAAAIAERVARLASLPLVELDELRRSQAAALAGSSSSSEWERRLAATTTALDDGLARRRPSPPLSRVLKRQLDPRRPLVELADDAARAASAAGATLSVVVACYSLGALIDETVESIWRSTRVPDEVIVVDDGSPDDATREALAALAERAQREGRPLRVLRQSNRGLAGARNTGLAAATGAFVSFLDGDDLISPSFYELAVTLLERDPGLGAVAAWSEIFGEGVVDGFWNAPQPELPLLLVENQVFVPAVTRTSLLRELGGYDERQRYNYEDWELSIRYLDRGHTIVTIPRYLQRYRVRADSLYRTMNPVQNQIMRERLFETCGPTLARFAGEVALQLEHRLAERTFVAAPPLSAITESLTQVRRHGLAVAPHLAKRILARAMSAVRRRR